TPQRVSVSAGSSEKRDVHRRRTIRLRDHRTFDRLSDDATAPHVDGFAMAAFGGEASVGLQTIRNRRKTLRVTDGRVETCAAEHELDLRRLAGGDVVPFDDECAPVESCRTCASCLRRGLGRSSARENGGGKNGREERGRSKREDVHVGL